MHQVGFAVSRDAGIKQLYFVFEVLFCKLKYKKYLIKLIVHLFWILLVEFHTVLHKLHWSTRILKQIGLSTCENVD